MFYFFKKRLFFFAFFTIVLGNAQEPINVLFLGNSLTYFHDMPETLQEMLNETHPNFTIEHRTLPGMSLHGHLELIVELRTENMTDARYKKEGEVSESERKLVEKDWDIIVLQTGTVGLLIPNTRKTKEEPAIDSIKSKATNPNCRFILFKTWPSKREYPKEYCHSSFSPSEKHCAPLIENLNQEMELIDSAFGLVAENHDLELTKNGNVFYTVLQQYPELNIYEDAIHPNANGAFLNACLFYQTLTDEKASDLKFIGEMDAYTAAMIKEIAGQEF